jgi:hypothetical protein
VDPINFGSPTVQHFQEQQQQQQVGSRRYSGFSFHPSHTHTHSLRHTNKERKNSEHNTGFLQMAVKKENPSHTNLLKKQTPQEENTTQKENTTQEENTTQKENTTQLQENNSPKENTTQSRKLL